MANLSLAEREGLFFFISLFEGLTTLFMYFSKRNISLIFSSGKYLDGFDLLLEKLLKKYFIILSSIEWKLTIKILPPGLRKFVAFVYLS